MTGRKITVTEASRHFADLVNRTYYRGESTVLMRSGEPVAMMVLVGGASITGRDWLARWCAMPHLEGKDAESFATCVEDARKNQTLPESSWD